MLVRFSQWLRADRRRMGLFLLGIAGIVIAVAYVVRRVIPLVTDDRSQGFITWSSGDVDARAALVTERAEACPDAPFILPAEGWIGLLYGDPRGPYSTARPHQGIDIFSEGEAGITPVFAAYDGYLTRERDWRSAVIIRVPEDPLQPDRQIWLYYTHMANEAGDESFIVSEYAPGTRDKFIEQGTLIGFTGSYAGGGGRSVWVHLHFSIVVDDGRGGYTNELDFDNTIDPSRYLGLAVNYGCAPEVPVCSARVTCEDAVLSRSGG